MVDACPTNVDLDFRHPDAAGVIHALEVDSALHDLAIFCPLPPTRTSFTLFAGLDITADYFCGTLHLALHLCSVLPHIGERTCLLLHCGACKSVLVILGDVLRPIHVDGIVNGSMQLLGAVLEDLEYPIVPYHQVVVVGLDECEQVDQRW